MGPFYRQFRTFEILSLKIPQTLRPKIAQKCLEILLLLYNSMHVFAPIILLRPNDGRDQHQFLFFRTAFVQLYLQ